MGDYAPAANARLARFDDASHGRSTDPGPNCYDQPDTQNKPQNALFCPGLCLTVRLRIIIPALNLA